MFVVTCVPAIIYSQVECKISVKEHRNAYFSLQLAITQTFWFNPNILSGASGQYLYCCLYFERTEPAPATFNGNKTLKCTIHRSVFIVEKYLFCLFLRLIRLQCVCKRVRGLRFNSGFVNWVTYRSFVLAQYVNWMNELRA